METPPLPTHEDIGKAYDQGKTAVRTLFHETIGQLSARLQNMKDRVSKNSRNSGGQPGHVGSTILI